MYSSSPQLHTKETVHCHGTPRGEHPCVALFLKADQDTVCPYCSSSFRYQPAGK